MDSVPWMSLKTRSERSRWLRSAQTPRPRLRVLAWCVASKVGRVTGRRPLLRAVAGHGLVGHAGRRRFRRDDQPPAAAATHLSAFTSGGSRLVGGPLVSRPLLVRGAPALAGDLALLFRRHRREPSSLFTFSSIHRSASVLLVPGRANDIGTLAGRFRRWILDLRRSRLVERGLRGFVRVFVRVVVARVLIVCAHRHPRVYQTLCHAPPGGAAVSSPTSAS